VLIITSFPISHNGFITAFFATKTPEPKLVLLDIFELG